MIPSQSHNAESIGKVSRGPLLAALARVASVPGALMTSGVPMAHTAVMVARSRTDRATGPGSFA
jgi:hypothetical protein